MPYATSSCKDGAGYGSGPIFSGLQASKKGNRCFQQVPTPDSKCNLMAPRTTRYAIATIQTMRKS
jgi:hypothetical protein